jgi:ParB/RepB/Spo0J family partition protein
LEETVMAKKKAESTRTKRQATKAARNEATDPSRKRGRQPKPPMPYDGPNLTLGGDKVKDLTLKSIQIDDETFQIRFSSVPDKALLDSIRTLGIQIPLIVRPHPEKDGKYQLICGFRRANAANMLKLKSVPVVVRELNDEDAQIVAYAENEYRKTLRDLDRARAMAKLRESGKTTAEIAQLFRLRDRQVQRLEGLLGYPEELKSALEDESSGITTTHALILMLAKRKHGGKFHLNEWLQVAKETNSVEELKKEINKKFSGGRGKVTLIRRHDGKVSFSFNFNAADVEQKEAAVKELRALLAELES